MKKIFILVFISLLFSNIQAQVKTYAQREIETAKSYEPKWVKTQEIRDIIYAPYDSSYLFIRRYPDLEAYKKYIGQKLFFLEYQHPKREGYYYTIIDILSANSDKYKKDHSIIGTENANTVKDGGRINFVQKYDDELALRYYCPDYYGAGSNIRYGYRLPETVLLIDLYDEKTYKSDKEKKRIKDNIPYFVLRDEKSGDTVYTMIFEASNLGSFLLVGSYVKLQQKYIGKFIYKVRSFPTWYDANPKFTKWKCIDVIFDNRENLLVLQNTDSLSEEREIKIAENEIKECDNCKDDNIFVEETTFNKRIDNYFAELYKADKEQKERALEEKRANVAFKKKVQQETAKRKQELISKYGIANAQKIIDGKLEIGMSKAVCKEIVFYVSIIDKTATMETWRIYGAYLYFEGDKLVRIKSN
jgi:hypothetical protein